MSCFIAWCTAETGIVAPPLTEDIVMAPTIIPTVACNTDFLDGGSCEGAFSRHLS